MIVKEPISIFGRQLDRTYSDKNLKIQKIGTNEIYDEAIDLQNVNYSYLETEIPIETKDEN